MCCISLFQKDREGRSENLGGPEQPKRNKARKSQKEQERAKRPRKKPKRKRGQEEDESLKILEEENLAKLKIEAAEVEHYFVLRQCFRMCNIVE